MQGAVVLNITTRLENNAPKIAAQRRTWPNVTAGADYHITNKYRIGMHKGRRIDDGRYALDCVGSVLTGVHG
jgi:hypothetical protein